MMIWRLSALAVCLVVWFALSAQAALAGTIERVSVNTAGHQGNSYSSLPSVSADGRFVAFLSDASDLVTGDTNDVWDVFVHDRVTGTTERVSVNTEGEEGNWGSGWSSISADGRFVAFYSEASTLVTGDTNSCGDVFVHDRETHTTERVSVSSGGEQGNQMSAVKDWAAGPISISADGRFIAFPSFASNLVPGDMNDAWDVFVHDRGTGTTERLSVNNAGVEGSGDSGYTGAARTAMSEDGRFVVFQSLAPDLVPDDTNDTADVFVRDRLTGTTERVSISSGGVQGNGVSWDVAMSAEGRFVAFASGSDNLVVGDSNGETDVFLHDRGTGTTERLSVGSAGQESDGWSLLPVVSADGRFVAFESVASNLVSGDTNGVLDAFVCDRLAGTIERVSVSAGGKEGNGGSGHPAISADGRFVAFDSEASNLVPGDTNDGADIFVRDRGPVMQVDIDIKPGSERNPVNPEAEGVLPVAVFSSDTFDATDIDPSTVHLAGASVAQNPDDGKWMIQEQNENGDALLDVRLSFDTESIDVERLADDYAVLAGSTFGGVEFEGRDRVTIVPKDIPNDYWALEAIAECMAGEVVMGYADGFYRPNVTVTRDQMAVFVSRAMAGGDEAVPQAPDEATFLDVPATSWALKYVEYAVDQSVVAGYEDGLYHPEYQVNRAQMAVYIARALVAPTGDASLVDYVPSDPHNFPDVPDTFWSYKHIEYCVENGVVAGYLDGYYYPEYVVTRDQMAVYVARAFDLPM